jgi:hypothetical protein
MGREVQGWGLHGRIEVETMKTPEDLIGADALLTLSLHGYEVVPKASTLIDSKDSFEEFWAAYPKKQAKPAAMKAYRAAIKRKVRHETIMEGVARLVASRPDPQFTPMGSTWLNQDRWNDTPTRRPGVSGMMDDLRQEIANGDGRAGQARIGSDASQGIWLLGAFR